MSVTKTFKYGKAHFDVEINLKPLDEFRATSDSILFTDLIKRMIREDPDDRETCQKLMKHAVFMNEDEQCKIVEQIADKCFLLKKNYSNPFLITILDKDELHLEGFLGLETEEWKKFELGMTKTPELQIKNCSSLLKIFEGQVISIINEF